MKSGALLQVYHNYVRFYRAVSYYFPTDDASGTSEVQPKSLDSEFAQKDLGMNCEHFYIVHISTMFSSLRLNL